MAHAARRTRTASKRSIVDAFCSVHSFFFVGGFLVCHGTCTKLKGLHVTSHAGFFCQFPLLLAHGLRRVRLTPLCAN